MSHPSPPWSKLERKLESSRIKPTQAPTKLEVPEEDVLPVYLERIPDMPPAYREIFIQLEGTLSTEGTLPTEGTPTAGGGPAVEDPPSESFLRFLVRLGKRMLSSVWGSIRNFLSFIGVLAKKAEDQPDSTPFDFEKQILEMSEKQKAIDAESIDQASKTLREKLKNQSPQEQRTALTVWGKMLGWVGDAWNAFRGWLPDLSFGALKRRGEQLSSGIRCMMIKVGDVFLNAWKWLSGGIGPSL